MRLTRQILGSHPSSAGRQRFAVVWSEVYRDKLRRIAAREFPPESPVDPELAPQLLNLANGFFATAERKILRLLEQNIGLCEADAAVFISFLNALFSVQRFDVVVAMLRDRHAISNEFEIDVNSTGLSLTCVRWEISPSERSRFTFDPSVYQTDASRHEKS